MPYTKQRMVLTVEDLDDRLPGNTVYDSGSSQTRRDALLGKYLGKLDKRVVRLEEFQLAQALQTGKATISGNGVAMKLIMVEIREILQPL